MAEEVRLELQAHKENHPVEKLPGWFFHAHSDTVTCSEVCLGTHGHLEAKTPQ
jgi:hypothetical protein